MSQAITISPTYIPLRNHSDYSLLEGATPIQTLVQLGQKHQFPALGLTDTGNLFGAMEFALEAQKARIQPILGCQLRLTPPSSQNLTTLSPWALALFVQNEVGYKNLMKIVSRSTINQRTEGHGQVSLKQLSGLTEGLIALSGGRWGPLNQLIIQGQKDEALSLGKSLSQLFPRRFYIELGRYGYADDPILESSLVNWAYEENWPLVATQEAFFPLAEMHEAHDALLCIAQGSYVNEAERHRVTPEHYLKTTDQMADLFSDLPEALQNTIAIAQRCHFLLTPIAPALPAYPCASEAETLKEKAQEGLEQRLHTHVWTQGMTDPEKENLRTHYHERLTYELNVIIQMGFAGYFLIVADFIQWAKGQQIPVGPGRGSGASSLVAWSLLITDVDPIRFGLLFERFLNPERVSVADFDIDFCQKHRDRVIAYVQEKYGADRVAHIMTFGKLQARAVLRDVGRVLQMPYSQVDRICKLIPNNPAHPTPLPQAIAESTQLQELAKEDATTQHLLNLGQQLEGLYRHGSTHAAGVVIGRNPLEEIVPLYQDPHASLPATQFSMKYVELAGLVKFDFLGLKTLTIIQSTVDMLKERDITLDISSIPLDDGPTFDLLTRVETVGVFQVESAGMGDVLRKLCPTRFEELIALVALYRPGPMDDIPRYLACRHGAEKITYPYPCLNEILEETFGVMVYQEQVLQIARSLAGYTLGGADLLRRAMGKKIKKEMQAQRKIFIDGVLTHNAPPPGEDQNSQTAFASQLFDQIAKFAGYAFNKGHAAPYALLLYQTAYLKANSPVEFLTASLNQDFQNTDKLAVFVREAKRMGIPILPPDLNRSQTLFHIEPAQDSQKGTTQGIRYGLAALKNVGQGAMEDVIATRNSGSFISIWDFLERLPQRAVNKRQMEGLIAAGAFDSLHPHRYQLMASIETLLRYTQEESASQAQQGLFATQETRPKLAEVDPWPTPEALRHEYSAIGFYLTRHPLDTYVTDLEHLNVVSSAAMTEACKQTSQKESVFPMAGILLSVQQKSGKSGKKYAFLRLSDSAGIFEIVVFSELLGKAWPLLEPGQPLYLEVAGRLDGEHIRLTCQNIQNLDTILTSSICSLVLTTSSVHALKALRQALSNAIDGPTDIKIRLPIKANSKPCHATLALPRSIRLTGALKATLEQIPDLTLDASTIN